jgi:hypothetical protein
MTISLSKLITTTFNESIGGFTVERVASDHYILYRTYAGFTVEREYVTFD